MAIVYGVNKTKMRAGTPANRLDPGLNDGRVKCSLDTYECDSTASGTVIQLGGLLTKGAVIIDIIVWHDALGGSVTLDVGDAEDDDRYNAAEDASSAGTFHTDLADGANYATDETDEDNTDRQVLITTGGAAATGTIKIAILYTND